MTMQTNFASSFKAKKILIGINAYVTQENLIHAKEASHMTMTLNMVLTSWVILYMTINKLIDKVKIKW